jgi:hypothetical protein
MRKSMKYLVSGIMVSLIVAVGLVMVGSVSADEVDPSNVLLTCLRTSQDSSPVTNVTYYQGNSMSLSNSTMYTGSTTSSTPQNLDGCVITITAGQPGVTNNVTATGYNISTNDGTWGASFVIPAYNPCYIEVTVSNTAIFTYPRYRISTQEALPE